MLRLEGGGLFWCSMVYSMSFSRFRYTFATVKARSFISMIKSYWYDIILYQNETNINLSSEEVESIKGEQQYLIKKQCFWSAAVYWMWIIGVGTIQT